VGDERAAVSAGVGLTTIGAVCSNRPESGVCHAICTRRLVIGIGTCSSHFRVGEEADALCLHAWFGVATDEGVDADDLALAAG
jgi:hypothetical protein